MASGSARTATVATSLRATCPPEGVSISRFPSPVRSLRTPGAPQTTTSKIFDVVVWGAPGVRSDLTGLGNLLIDTPSGGHVALKDVATVAVRAEPDAIVHDDVLRSVEVAAKVTGDPAAVVSAVHSRLA